MIDQDLIKSGSMHLKSMLASLTTDHNGLILIEDVFTDQIIEKLLKFCIAADDWEPQLAADNKTVVANREKISWRYDCIVEETHTILENATPEISRLIKRDNLVFGGVNLWKDTEGYTIKPHTDNPVIQTSLQVYIQNLPTLSTIFEYDGNLVHTNPNTNSGYISDNLIGIPHWLPNSVPAEFNRYSLHAIWSY